MQTFTEKRIPLSSIGLVGVLLGRCSRHTGAGAGFLSHYAWAMSQGPCLGPGPGLGRRANGRLSLPTLAAWACGPVGAGLGHVQGLRAWLHKGPCRWFAGTMGVGLDMSRGSGSKILYETGETLAESPLGTGQFGPRPFSVGQGPRLDTRHRAQATADLATGTASRTWGRSHGWLLAWRNSKPTAWLVWGTPWPDLGRRNSAILRGMN